MDRGARRAAVRGVAKSQTRQSDFRAQHRRVFVQEWGKHKEPEGSQACCPVARGILLDQGLNRHPLHCKWKSFCRVRLCDPTDYPVREFSRPEHWSGEPFPSSGDLPSPGIEPRSPALQGRFLTTRPSRKPLGMKKTRSPKEFRAYRALCFCLAGNISIVNKCFGIHFSISNVSESE